MRFKGITTRLDAASIVVQKASTVASSTSRINQAVQVDVFEELIK
jgi:hypothetical protein